MINESFHLAFSDKLNAWTWVISCIIIFVLIVAFLLQHRIYRGIKYFWHHWTITNRLEKQMIDAGFGIQRSYYIETPKIQLSFNRGFSSGMLTIKNALKFDKRLDDVVMSAALGRFVVERHYQTDDSNFYIYELVNGSESFKMTFKSFDKFLNYSRTIPTYSLFLDKRSVIKLQHCLFAGMTGSGKTYAAYSLILQMLNKPIKFELYYADPKGSGIAVIGDAIAKERTAVGVDRIIEMLEEFVEKMRARKAEMYELLKSQIDADYSTFGLSPYVYICDEYASFAAVLASKDKATRDKVKSLLYEVVLQGRQLGFFLFIIMQKSDATLIDTALRDNVPLKAVFGNSEQQTYVTAFGAGVDIPRRHYRVGEGVFTEPELAPEPKLVQCPHIKFDILRACKQARVV